MSYTLKTTHKVVIPAAYVHTKLVLQSYAESYCLCVYVCTHVCPLTAVDSLDANVISRFPFSPTSAGTKINTSEISLNTSQC